MEWIGERATKSFDVLTPADLCVDLLLWGPGVVPEFGQKEKLVDGYLLELGGSCSIFACQAAKLGLRTALIGKVGRDALGELVVNRLAQAGVDARWVERSPDLITGLGVALCTADDRAILTYPGSLAALEPADLTDAILGSARHLHIGSYYLQTGLRPAMPGILARARRLGLSVSLDTNWDPAEEWRGLDEILPLVDLFLPNENELLAVTGRSCLEDALRSLTERAPGLTVLVKRGELGAAAWRRGTLHHCPPPRVDTILDAVGAGDSFDAGAVHGFLQGAALPEMLRRGCICGARSLSRRGGIAGQIRLDEMEVLLNTRS